MANVRFYRLSQLPTPYDAATHQGVFVHVTTGNTTYQAGLWFGGSQGWELLTNNTDVNYINSLIVSKINELDVDTVNTVTSENASSGTGTKLTFKGVKEVNGKIQQGEGTSTITIGDGALKISGYGETTSGATPSIPTVNATDVFSANDTADNTIALSNAFVFNSTNKTIGIRTKTAVSATNNIVTETDIASLAGAMHYVGAIQKVSTTEPTSGNYYTAIVGSTTYYLSTTTESTATAKTAVAGDTLIVSGTTNITPFETGDMFVYSDATHANVVQTNMTVGVADGQIAKNDQALTTDQIIIASANGIKTSGYTLSGASSRELTVASGNQDADTSIYHSATTTDSLTILGQSREKTLKIASINASIDVRGTNDNEVDIDLVWNTSLS